MARLSDPGLNPRVGPVCFGQRAFPGDRGDDPSPVLAAEHRRVDREVEASREGAVDEPDRSRIPVKYPGRVSRLEPLDDSVLGAARTHRKDLAWDSRVRKQRLECLDLQGLCGGTLPREIEADLAHISRSGRSSGETD